MGTLADPAPNPPGSKAWKDKLQESGAPEIDKLVADIHAIQTTTGPSHGEGPPLQRGFHAKGVGMPALFRIRDDVPPNVRTGLFAQQGREFDAIVRFSNAFSVNQRDSEPDQRGLAIRVFLEDRSSGRVQDFLMTNTPVVFGRDAEQFVRVSKFLVDHSKPVAFLCILAQPGRFRILRRLLAGVKSASYASERYWSRTPFKIGDYAMKYMVQPVDSGETETRRGRNYLREELQERLRKRKKLKFDFRIQLYQDDARTPLEDASREWKEEDAPFATVAELEIPDPSQNEEDQRKANEGIEKMAFSPWNTTDFLPLGRMNLTRRAVYRESAKKRQGCPLDTGP